MRIVDIGSGVPVVVVPGAQGRWEWMAPGVRALAARCRVITFSLADERSCGGVFDSSRGFDCYVDQIGAALDAAGLGRAVVCGVSYGGLVAAVFAARRPERVTALVLASALPPDWRPDRRARAFLRTPRLLLPAFLISSVRLYPEIAAASNGVVQSVRIAGRHALNVLTHMLSPSRMARRVRLLEGLDLAREVRGITCPVLVLTGEPSLDRVMPVALTRGYLRLVPQARHAVIERTGHLGVVTRPERFAELVGDFAIAEAARQAPDTDRKARVG